MNHNLCEVGVSCPAAPGAFSFVYSIYISPVYPSFRSLPIIFVASDQNNNQLFCLTITTSISVTEGETQLDANEGIKVRSLKNDANQ